jgi:hypothetical protein
MAGGLISRDTGLLALRDLVALACNDDWIVDRDSGSLLLQHKSPGHAVGYMASIQTETDDYLTLLPLVITKQFVIVINVVSGILVTSEDILVCDISDVVL